MAIHEDGCPRKRDIFCHAFWVLLLFTKKQIVKYMYASNLGRKMKIVLNCLLYRSTPLTTRPSPKIHGPSITIKLYLLRGPEIYPSCIEFSFSFSANGWYNRRKDSAKATWAGTASRNDIRRLAARRPRVLCCERCLGYILGLIKSVFKTLQS